MALEENVKTLDEIDEKYKDLYIKNDEGTFDINISGLKTALNKERINRKKLEKQLNAKPNVDEDVQTELNQAKQELRDMKINNIVKSEAVKAGVNPDYVDDVMILTKGNFELDDNDEVIMLDSSGEPTGITVNKFFNSEYKKNKPGYYLNSGKNGSGSSGNNTSVRMPGSYDRSLKKAIRNKDTLAIVSSKNKIIK